MTLPARTTLATLLCACAFLQALLPASAAERAVLGNRLEVPPAFSADPRTAYTLSALRQKAIRSGTTRIIVGVRTPFAPEGAMAADGAAQQRGEIAAMHARVLDKVPSLRSKPERIKRFATIPFMALEVDAAELEALAGLSEITSIEEDRAESPTLAQSSPLIGATGAWASGFTGLDWAVAVLDTGADKTHAYLASKVVSEACYSTTSVGSGSTTICPGGVEESTLPNSAMPYGGTCPAGKCDHGTHVAGIAAGNSVAFSGVGKDASVIAVQVFSNFADCSPSASPCVRTFTSDQILGLERVYALRNTYPIASVNMSLGGGRYYSQATCDAANVSRKAAIDNLRSVKIATVISSGNDAYSDSMGAPGCISSAVSVGSTWDQAFAATYGFSACSDVNPVVDRVACYSNSVSFLDLLAPGSQINSSIPGGGFANYHGTSMAAPQVAGAWSVLRQKYPNATVDETLAALKVTGTNVTDARNAVVKPRIAVDRALNSSVRFSATSQTVNEAAGTMTVTILRGTTSLNMPLSVTVGTVPGTAVPGTDYTTTTGPLSWPANDTTSRTFNVPILYNPATTGTRSFSLAFSSPTAGLLVAAPSTHTVNIQDAASEIFPPGCQQPAGWTTPAGANAGWSVATDTQSEGSCSLKANSVTHNQKAQVQFSGTFVAGSVGFYRRVSSELNYDCLRFYVDGVEQNIGSNCANLGGLGQSGEVPWGFVSVPMPAGPHTLAWSYEKDGSVNNGSDTAWIDNVTLPALVANQTITFGPLGAKTFGAAPFTVSATASSSLAVTFSSTTLPVCTVAGNTVTLVAAGNCTIAANQAGNEFYFPAPQVTQSFTVAKANQAITFGALPAKTFGAAPFPVSATGGASGNPVTFSSTTTGVCTTGGTNGSTVTLVAVGNCTIAADQAGNANYLAAPQATQTFAVGKASQAITFGALAAKTLGAAPFTVSATGGASGNQVTFGTTTPGVCTTGGTNGATVTLVAAGNCTIAADQAGNANYLAAPQVTQTFAVNKASQAITFGALAAKTFGAAPFTVGATASSGLAVAFSSTTLPVCTVTGNTVTLVAAGTCTIAADQAGNANFNPAPQVTQAFAVGKASQAITFGALPAKTFGAAPFTVSATGGASGNPVVFSSLTLPVCTTGGTNGATVTLVAVGNCTIAADQAGNANYLAAPQVTQSFAVGSAPLAVRGDVNGDAKADLFWRSVSPGLGLSWWTMNGAAATGANYHEVASEWQIVEVGDLDGDLKADLIWRRTTDGAAYLWTLDGFAFKGFFDLGVLDPAVWTLAGAADLNGDGKADVLWRNADGTLYGWIMNGGVIASQGVIGNPGADWQVIAVADMDGDKKADIVFRNASSGQVFVWFMNGLALTSAGSPGGLPAADWNLLAAADFDGDGKGDLLWRSTAGDTWVWIMNGASFVSGASIGNPGLAWSIPAVADLDGDGKADLVWRHTDGTTYFWKMNGAVPVAFQPVANPGITWQIVAP